MLHRDVWKDFESHPAWKEIQQIIRARITAKERELEMAALRGDTIVAARLAAELQSLRWFLELPRTEQQIAPRS